jgi:hypothetical protein
MTTAHSNDMQQCIAECQSCHALCLETVSHCLEMGGSHAEPRHIGLLESCAEICQTSANFMIRGSELHTRTCAACAEVCRACEADCRRLSAGDEVMARCADACAQCAESCERMAAAVH